MANVQQRTGATGIKTYRVGYYDDLGKFKYTPTMMIENDAWRIKEIIKEQGYEIALQILGIISNLLGGAGFFVFEAKTLTNLSTH